MTMIYVKAREGRTAYYEGKRIPHDKFIPVANTPYIRRLVQHWEDLEVEGGVEALEPKTTGSAQAPQPPAESASPTSAVQQTAPDKE